MRARPARPSRAAAPPRRAALGRAHDRTSPIVHDLVAAGLAEGPAAPLALVLELPHELAPRGVVDERGFVGLLRDVREVRPRHDDLRVVPRYLVRELVDVVLPYIYVVYVTLDIRHPKVTSHMASLVRFVEPLLMLKWLIHYLLQNTKEAKTR